MITLLSPHFLTITEKKCEACIVTNRIPSSEFIKQKLNHLLKLSGLLGITAIVNQSIFHSFSLGLEWANVCHLTAAQQIVVLGIHPWLHRNRVPLSFMSLPQNIAACIKFYYFFFLIKDVTFYQMTVNLIQKTLSWHQKALIRNCLL